MGSLSNIDFRELQNIGESLFKSDLLLTDDELSNVSLRTSGVKVVAQCDSLSLPVQKNRVNLCKKKSGELFAQDDLLTVGSTESFDLNEGGLCITPFQRVISVNSHTDDSEEDDVHSPITNLYLSESNKTHRNNKVQIEHSPHRNFVQYVVCNNYQKHCLINGNCQVLDTKRLSFISISCNDIKSDVTDANILHFVEKATGNILLPTNIFKHYHISTYLINKLPDVGNSIYNLPDVISLIVQKTTPIKKGTCTDIQKSKGQLQPFTVRKHFTENKLLQEYQSRYTHKKATHKLLISQDDQNYTSNENSAESGFSEKVLNNIGCDNLKSSFVVFNTPNTVDDNSTKLEPLKDVSVENYEVKENFIDSLSSADANNCRSISPDATNLNSFEALVSDNSQDDIACFTKLFEENCVTNNDLDILCSLLFEGFKDKCRSNEDIQSVSQVCYDKDCDTDCTLAKLYLSSCGNDNNKQKNGYIWKTDYLTLLNGIDLREKTDTHETKRSYDPFTLLDNPCNKVTYNDNKHKNGYVVHPKDYIDHSHELNDAKFYNKLNEQDRNSLDTLLSVDGLANEVNNNKKYSNNCTIHLKDELNFLELLDDIKFTKRSDEQEAQNNTKLLTSLDELPCQINYGNNNEKYENSCPQVKNEVDCLELLNDTEFWEKQTEKESNNHFDVVYEQSKVFYSGHDSEEHRDSCSIQLNGETNCLKLLDDVKLEKPSEVEASSQFDLLASLDKLSIEVNFDNINKKHRTSQSNEVENELGHLQLLNNIEKASEKEADDSDSLSLEELFKELNISKKENNNYPVHLKSEINCLELLDDIKFGEKLYVQEPDNSLHASLDKLFIQADGCNYNEKCSPNFGHSKHNTDFSQLTNKQLIEKPSEKEANDYSNLLISHELLDNLKPSPKCITNYKTSEVLNNENTDEENIDIVLDNLLFTQTDSCISNELNNFSNDIHPCNITSSKSISNIFPSQHNNISITTLRKQNFNKNELVGNKSSLFCKVLCTNPRKNIHHRSIPQYPKNLPEFLEDMGYWRDFSFDTPSPDDIIKQSQTCSQ